jgi:hypothetical protein
MEHPAAMYRRKSPLVAGKRVFAERRQQLFKPLHALLRGKI